MNVSLICTVKNEEASIKDFLDSLLSQSRPPDEIILVDGGSTDSTAEIINYYIKDGAPIRLIVKDGANIARGRNIAIKNSGCDLIASTDAGCRLDKHWLESLVRPLEQDSDVDVVSGVYDLIGKTTFEKCVAELTSVNIVSLTAEEFLPSGRSIAFRKTAWQKVSGYPEHLDYAEDTAFDMSLKKAGAKFSLAKDAMVYWRMRGNIRSLFRQYYNYAKWDAIAGIARPAVRNMAILYCFLAVILILVALYYPLYATVLVAAYLSYYFVRYGTTSFIKLKKVRCLYYGPAIALTLLLANISGLLAGRIRK